DWLRRQLQADFPEGPTMLSISMSGPNPDELKALVNAIRDAYLKEIVNKENNARKTRLELLQRKADDFEEKLEAKRKELDKLAKAVGGGDPRVLAIVLAGVQAHHNAVLEQHTKVLIQIREAELDVRAAQAKLRARAAQLPERAVEKAFEKVIAEDEEVAKHKRK